MNNVIACIDGSQSALGVCDAAAWASLRMQAPLVLLHALEKTTTPGNENLSGAIGLGSRDQLLADLTELDEQRSRLALEHGKHMLDDARLRVTQLGVVNSQLLQRHGNLLETILDLQPETRLLVMGRLGEDHAQQTNGLGSHLESVVRAVTNPILLSIGDFNPPARFMIAYDGSDTADKAIDRVASSPLLKGLEGHLVMVGADADNRLAAAAQRLAAQGQQVTTALLTGDVHPALETYQKAHDIELMVMGAYGHSRIRQFFVGSHTAKMVSKSEIPLLLLR